LYGKYTNCLSDKHFNIASTGSCELFEFLCLFPITNTKRSDTKKTQDFRVKTLPILILKIGHMGGDVERVGVYAHVVGGRGERFFKQALFTPAYKVENLHPPS